MYKGRHRTKKILEMLVKVSFVLTSDQFTAHDLKHFSPQNKKDFCTFTKYCEQRFSDNYGNFTFHLNFELGHLQHNKECRIFGNVIVDSVLKFLSIHTIIIQLSKSCFLLKRSPPQHLNCVMSEIK